MRVGIIFALPDELYSFHRALLARGIDCCDMTQLSAGRSSFEFGGNEFTICMSGCGFSHAADAANLLAQSGADILVAAGISGALTDSLSVGDVTCGSRVWWKNEGGELQLVSEETPKPMAAAAISCDVITVSRVLVSKQEKAALCKQWNSSVHATCAVVDMETAAIAQVARGRRLSFMAMRAVSDRADEDLPLDVNAFIDLSGIVHRNRIALYAVMHPRIIPALLRVGKQTKMACQRLSDALIEWMECRSNKVKETN